MKFPGRKLEKRRNKVGKVWMKKNFLKNYVIYIHQYIIKI